ncbi:MAG: ATP-binding protein, partial [Bacteroides stercoris]
MSIYVEDTGIGIPKEEQEMIFARFYKRSEFSQGVGLGRLGRELGRASPGFEPITITERRA